MNHLKVIDHKDLVRDSNNKAILTNDSSALNKYREEREYKLRLAKVVEEHDKVKRDVAEIKQMLQTLLQRA
jgi:predicted transcriptional regulator